MIIESRNLKSAADCLQWQIAGVIPGNDSHKPKLMKLEAMKLLREHCRRAEPISEELVDLFEMLLGLTKKKEQVYWQCVNAAAAFEPPQEGEPLPVGVVTAVAAVIDEHGGLQDKPKPLDGSKGSEKRDFRHTARDWLWDPLFHSRWVEKRPVYLRREERKRKDPAGAREMLELARKAVRASS